MQPPSEFGRIDHGGDLGDAAVGDGEDEDGERGAVLAPGDEAGVAVDGRQMSSCCPGGHLRAGGDLGGSERDESAVRGVDGELHFGVENLQQLLEPTVACRAHKGVDHLAFNAHFTEEEIGALNLEIALTNFFNRINRTIKEPAGRTWG